MTGTTALDGLAGVEGASERTTRASRICICAPCLPATRGAPSVSPSRPPGFSSTIRRTASRTRPFACSSSLARARGVEARRDAMFSGEKINVSENRAVLHVALRAPRDQHVSRRRQGRRARGSFRPRPDGGVFRPGAVGRLDGAQRQAHSQRRQYRDRRLVSRPRDGLSRPAAVQAIPSLDVRFVANVDGADFTRATHDLDPHETLFIIASKTFTTLETMTNAAARAAVGPGRDRRRGRRQAPFRRAFDQRRGGGEVRHRHRQHVRLLGLGRRAATRWIRPSGFRP